VTTAGSGRLLGGGKKEWTGEVPPSNREPPTATQNRGQGNNLGLTAVVASTIESQMGKVIKQSDKEAKDQKAFPQGKKDIVSEKLGKRNRRGG